MEKQFVALLRGINVGGHRKVPMAALRDLAGELGLEAPRTYVASGNLVFAGGDANTALESRFETAIEERFGFRVDVIVRSKAEWTAYRKSNPFVAESEETANFVMLCIGKQPATDAHVEALRARASEKEKVERRGDAIWIWFGEGAGRSKIGSVPGKSVWTSRNWRTVVAIDEMMSD
ncbi:MAG: hypothetical protein JWO25_195 [Alphaproteobacteria bacterium]|nr:hypothetical protein [Alphaproteobacteria bacterium]